MNNVRIDPQLFQRTLRTHIEAELVDTLVKYMHKYNLYHKDAGIFYSNNTQSWILDKMPTCQGKVIQDRFRNLLKAKYSQVNVLHL